MKRLMREEGAYITLETSLHNLNWVDSSLSLLKQSDCKTKFSSTNAHFALSAEPCWFFRELIYAVCSQTTYSAMYVSFLQILSALHSACREIHKRNLP